jgi:hypothetical protein
MIRRLLFLLAVVLTAACAVSAQSTVGDWTIYSSFGRTVDKMVQTDSKVFYLSEGMLYSYDYKDNETYEYTTRNKLNDTDINDIRYNYDKDYLLVIYDDYNMDLLYDDGKVVNFPDLKESSSVVDKTINDVQFGDNRIYISTVFGFIIYDDQRHEVKESAIFNTNVASIVEMGDYLAAVIGSKLYTASKEGRHNTLDKFKVIGGFNVTSVHKCSDNLLAYINSKKFYTISIDFSRNATSINATNMSAVDQLMTMKDGFYVRNADKNLLLFNNNAELTKTVTVPDDFKNDALSTWQGDSEVWFGGTDGIGCYDISSSTPTVLSQRFRPEAFTCKYAVYINASQDGKRIYFTNLGPTTHMNSFVPSTTGGYNVAQTTNVLKDGKIYDISIAEAHHDIDDLVYFQNLYNNKALYTPTRMISDPNDEDRYYIGTGRDGLFVVQGNEQIMKFDKENSPLFSSWCTRVYDVNIDPAGNLWVGTQIDDVAGKSAYSVLPAAKLSSITDVKSSDWKVSSLGDTYQGKTDMGSLFCKKSNMAFFWNALWESGICALDTKGTYDNMNDDKYTIHTSFIDQDGNSFIADYYICAIEDQKGRVWIGTSMGIFEITNPADAINNTFTINRLKVPRNDGTNYADYLLDTEKINCMCVDASNRKWIATQMSGVYLVSEDGDEILEHFTTDNSYLPSDAVASVFCDPLSNIVYFGTSVGIASYNGTASPSKDNYDDVYAYPNPVRPDYSGWITVTGLMENSLVKIADAAGNVFYQGRSEGGMVTWDGCNAAGDRVKTGVYYVFASHSGDDSQMGVVTKILVVR